MNVETPNTVPSNETLNGADPQSETLTTPHGETPDGTTDTPSLDDLRKENERIKVALKKSNAEAASHRKKADELDKLKADAEAATLSETEKLKKQLADLQQERDSTARELQSTRLQRAIERAARQLNVIDEDAAFKLLDTSAIEYDDIGTPTNVDDLLKALVKAKPYLASNGKAALTQANATNPPRSQSGAPAQLNWEVISKMTPAEYEARRGEIQAWINAHPIRYGQF